MGLLKHAIYHYKSKIFRKKYYREIHRLMSLDVSLGVIGNQIWNWDRLGHFLRVHQAMYFGRQKKYRIRPMAYTDLINNAFEEISQRKNLFCII